jgi:hypothetical protein
MARLIYLAQVSSLVEMNDKKKGIILLIIMPLSLLMELMLIQNFYWLQCCFFANHLPDQV